MAADHSGDEQTHLGADATVPELKEQSRSPSPPYKKRRRASFSVFGHDDQRSPPPLDYGDAAGNPTTPPLPDEDAPPLPDEAAPVDDGWEFRWDTHSQSIYFYNNITHISTWQNPRVPEASATSYGSYDRYANSGALASTTTTIAPGTSAPRRPAGGYIPSIHGNYDPNADYAKDAQKQQEEEEAAATAAAAAAAAGLPAPNQNLDYTSVANFNRFDGRFQHSTINPDNHNDENKSRRQMSSFFDVDAAANSHDGRSLKAERRGQSISRKQLQQYKEKSRKKKEEKRRAWLRD